tara:strand:+ start:28030 stop:29010 length:981 start_codon:yes stop_codon:yes gene_type:complete
MKPTLLINPGTGWSATTPMFYTLALDNKYAHQGHYKENWFLVKLEKNDDSFNEIFKIANSPALKGSKGKRPHDHPWGSILSGRNEIAKDTPMDIFFRNKIKLDDYIEYYLKHWDNIKNDYAAVCDFCNGNWGLDYGFLKMIAPKLLDHFEIKVMMEFRDPVRRFYSEIGSFFANTLDFGSKNHHDFRIQSLVRRKKHTKLFFHYLTQGWYSNNSDYRGGYAKYVDVFGKENVYTVIMEDFWDKKQEKNQLQQISDFLSYKVEKIHENAYVPFMGKNAPQHEFLKDQWASDIEELTDEEYCRAVHIMSRYYNDFQNTFGYIPDSWKK